MSSCSSANKSTVMLDRHYRDGKLISSRQSIINQEIEDISAIGKLAEPEVNRTIDFVRGQNLVGANEVIDLHILAVANSCHQ